MVLDETSYVITVEVTQNDQDALDAAITYVRKKPAGSDTWVDVGTADEPGPVVWENRLRAESPDQGGAVVPDKPDAPDDSSSSDKPSTPGEDVGGDDGSGTIGGVTAPVGPGGGSTENGAPSDGDGAAGATPEAPGSTEGADRPADGGERPAGTDGTKPGADGAKPGTASPDGRPDDAADGAKHDSKKDDGAKTDGAAVSKPAASDGGTVVEGSVTGGAFAQTGDDLGIPMLIAFLVVVVSGVALAVVSRRRPPRS